MVASKGTSLPLEEEEKIQLQPQFQSIMYGHGTYDLVLGGNPLDSQLIIYSVINLMMHVDFNRQVGLAQYLNVECIVDTCLVQTTHCPPRSM